MSAPISPKRWANVMAIRNDTFIDICISEHFAKGSDGILVMARSTRSHGSTYIQVYLLDPHDGFTIGCVNTILSLILSWKTVMVAR